MTDPAAPLVSDLHGDFFNIVMAAAARGRDARRTFIEDLDALWARFVHPPGFGRARSMLARNRSVLLQGPPGGGRVAAAKVLLRELSVGNEQFYELVWEKSDERYQLEPEQRAIGDGDRIWLDLSQADEQAWLAFQRELSSIREAIARRGALLVVVVPGKGSEGLWPEYGAHLVAIQRPSAQEVLRRHLRIAGVPNSADLSMPDFLEIDRSLSQIARFAHLVAAACEKAPNADHREWYRDANAAYTGHRTKVADDIANLHRGSQRALLLAVAMLPGAHLDDVYIAAKALRDVAHYTDEQHVLERSDLLGSLTQIEAELDRGGHVRFSGLGYDAAVRTHFWHHMPELREVIQDWMRQLIDCADLPEAVRAQLVIHFADQCLHSRYRQALADSVARWTKDSPGHRSQMAAEWALRRALKSEEHGWFFRRQIYFWTLDGRLTDALARVIILMCVEVIVVSHPGQALVRLHQLSRRETRTTNARMALVEMIAADPWLRVLMLVRLTRPPVGAREWPSDVSLFLEFADSAALAATDGHGKSLILIADVRAMLTDGWRRVFYELAEAAWRPRLREWLVMASRSGRNGGLLVDVLVNAGALRSDVLGRLYSEARRLGESAGASGEASVFRDAVLQKICTVQGLQVP